MTTISTLPWNSIAESVVVTGAGRNLKHSEALESPCASCKTAPCCTHLPLHTFKMTNVIELDHALYLLNFHHIELGVSASGEWSVYYSYPCRYLNRKNMQCTVHNTAQQPQICVHYNPYNCWYKRAFFAGESEEFVRIDLARMQFLLNHIEFNEQRQITSVPAWEDLISLMQQFADHQKEPPPEPTYEDEAFSAWETAVLHPTDTPPTNGNGQYYAHEQLTSPCTGCAAHCCKTLIFPQGAPVHISNLDYYRFCLGFPGIELGIADDAWSLIVKTTCRHLQDNKCSIYDQPERPLICKYYDAWKCTYKPQFSLPRPLGLLRVRLEQHQWLTNCFQYDQSGNITAVPPMAEIRAAIETQWQQNGNGRLEIRN